MTENTCQFCGAKALPETNQFGKPMRFYDCGTRYLPEDDLNDPDRDWACLENEIRQLKAVAEKALNYLENLDIPVGNVTDRREWCDSLVGWVPPGHEVIVGSYKKRKELIDACFKATRTSDAH